MKKFNRVIGILLILFVVFSEASGVEAKSNSSKKTISQLQEEIKKAEEERKGLNSNLSDVKKIVANLEKEKKDLSNYVKLLDEQVSVIQDNIEQLKEDIEIKEQELVVTEANLVEALDMEAEQYEAMSNRIRLNYEHGEYYAMNLLLNSSSFGDFLNRSAYVKAVAEYDDMMLNQLIETREYVELCKKKLEEEKLTLENAKEGLENEQAALETLIAEKKKEIEAYEADIKNKEKAVREYEQEIAARNQIIKDLEKAVEAEKKRLEEENRKAIIYDGGTFKFPLKSYKRISDDYGYRMHPILNVEQFHNGVDFAADAGTDIYAAYDGSVVAAAYNSSMGNYVMIDHGSGLYTIYMHASKLTTKTGATVTKGQKIAEVGSTGRSTGNHLHFSVRVNGEYTSPWNYLSK